MPVFDQRNQQVDRQINVAGDINIHVAPPLDAREKRNRQRMLQKVRDFWIKGVLENSLHGAALIELGLEYKPEAVQHPWDMVIQQPDQSTQSIPPGTKIIDVFDELGGELLILGAPGSGKTTMLLELARDLIARAEQDETYPMPVVFNLSSWATRRLPLDNWLVEELNQRYDVPRKIGKAWVDADHVLPLLDGLDEVKHEQRGACVEAINQFRQTHGLVHVAVCSRTADYEALTTRLKLQGAMLIHPLTAEQIDAYLASFGEQLRVLRVALTEDKALRELAEAPLMLSIMVLAYQAAPANELVKSGSIEQQRKWLFVAYLERMFARRGVAVRYTQEQTVCWLSWLAGTMQRHNQSVLYLEWMQPNWLTVSLPESNWAMWTVMIISLLYTLVWAFLLLVTSSFLFLENTLRSGLFSMVLVGSVIGISISLFQVLFSDFWKKDRKLIRPIEVLQWSWPHALLVLQL